MTVPLRTQLLVLVVGLVALVVVVTSLAGTAVLRGYLLDRVDEQLRASVVRPAEARLGPDGRARRGSRADVAVLVLEYDAGGALLPSSAARLPVGGGPEVGDPGALTGRARVVDDVSVDRRWRVLAVSGPRGSRVAAVALDGVDDTVSRLLVIDGVVGLLALLGGGALARVAVRRSLRPLVTVEQTAHAIAAGDLDARVPVAGPTTEVGSLATSFNAMVDRFASAYAAQQRSQEQAQASEARMRQFVGDASHELRTPLTSIRGFSELFRQGAVQDPEQLSQVLRRIEDEAVRMGLLVEDLLLLARLDQARPLLQEEVDLLSVASDVVQGAVAAHGRQHDIALTADLSQGRATVVGDTARLHQVVGNLVANAVAHTAPGTAVRVGVSTSEGHAVVQVEDDGAGMPGAVAERVFERFYRADTARGRTGAAGAGLGLSIVAALVAAHGGRVEVRSEVGSGSCFTVRLPLAGAGARP